MSALPLRTAISDTYPNPSNAVARTGFGALWDSINEFTEKAEIDVASAATCNIGAQLSTKLKITGTTGITSFGTTYRGAILLRFSGALTITHNATTLICPGGASITTMAGDTMMVAPKSTTSGTANGWVVLSYQQYRSAGSLDSVTTDGTGTGLTVNNTNSTSAYQQLIAGTMTFNTVSVNALGFTTVLTGGATTTAMRGVIFNTTYTPVANATIQNILNQFLLDTNVSPAAVYGVSTNFILNGMLGTITNFYGNAVSFAPNAASSTNITSWASYHASNIADGTSMAVGTAYGFRSQMNVAAGTRWGFYHGGTADNAFNAKTRFGGITAPVSEVDVTGNVGVSGNIFLAQGAPTAETTTATTTAAKILNGLVTCSGTAYTLTLDTGTAMDTAVPTWVVGRAVDWSIISTASGTITLAAAAAHTIVGTTTTTTLLSSQWRTRKTAANTYITYRIS